MLSTRDTCVKRRILYEPVPPPVITTTMPSTLNNLLALLSPIFKPRDLWLDNFECTEMNSRHQVRVTSCKDGIRVKNACVVIDIKACVLGDLDWRYRYARPENPHPSRKSAPSALPVPELKWTPWRISQRSTISGAGLRSMLRAQ